MRRIVYRRIDAEEEKKAAAIGKRGNLAPKPGQWCGWFAPLLMQVAEFPRDRPRRHRVHQPAAEWRRGVATRSPGSTPVPALQANSFAGLRVPAASSARDGSRCRPHVSGVGSSWRR
jgi:hypothetical protein